ncbi:MULTISPECIES: hypothetical protein [Calothrix]|uniref:Uncharacterized protein n=2 Tax=Calothrix TaxID=1186 RepID=A0ABR8AHJ1_9CYAN|nr:MULTISPECIES: hypothetical protein [Calothrix]MBD2199502.1 hypothetical protein [Calothrix parietina FACHB-288]MBD2228118.1 hypothetical protein [Calothrix anomala FACHB-343]
MAASRRTHASIRKSLWRCLGLEYRDRSIIGFAENMSNPLSFLGVAES